MNDPFLNSSDSAWLKRAHIDAEMSDYDRGHADALEEWHDTVTAMKKRIRQLEKWNAYLLPTCGLFALLAGMAIATMVRSGN